MWASRCRLLILASWQSTIVEKVAQKAHFGRKDALIGEGAKKPDGGAMKRSSRSMVSVKVDAW